MAPENGEFKGETHEALEGLRRDIARLETKVDGLDKKVDDLVVWRARLLGIAAGVSFIVALVVRLFG